MRPARPAPGTFLGTDNEFPSAMVVERGWPAEEIDRRLIDQGVDPVPELLFDTWHYHTVEQRRAGGVDEFDSFWSPAGAGATTIDVVVLS